MGENDWSKYETAVEKRWKYYEPRFQKFARGGRLSWNWAAFFISSGWFFYRRMYRWAALNAIAAGVLLATCASFSPVYVGDLLAPAVVFAYVFALFLALPIGANWIYYRQIEVHREKTPTPPSVWTALGAAAIAMSSIVMAGITFTSITSDHAAVYRARLHVGTGLTIAFKMSNELSEFYERHGRFPDADEAAKLQPAERFLPAHVSSLDNTGIRGVVYDVRGHRLVVTYSYFLLKGKRIALRAAETSAGLEWRCRSIDVPQKHLPAVCRD